MGGEGRQRAGAEARIYRAVVTLNRVMRWGSLGRAEDARGCHPRRGEAKDRTLPSFDQSSSGIRTSS